VTETCESDDINLSECDVKLPSLSKEVLRKIKELK